MRETECGMFDCAREHPLARSLVKYRSHLLRSEHKVDEIADVVEKSCKIGLFRVSETCAARQSSTQDGSPQRVLPENRRVETDRRLPNLHEGAGQGDDPDPCDPNGADRTMNGVCKLPATEQWRVRHAQALRGERFIAANQVGDALHVNVFGRLLQFAEQ